jgi:hypothetical protein
MWRVLRDQGQGGGAAPTTLKDGEVAVSKADWERIKAKADDMGKYKAEAKLERSRITQRPLMPRQLR